MNEDPLLVLKTPAPMVCHDAAGELLMVQYGISADLRPLVSERDQNFLASSNDGRKYILKIANSAELPDVTEFQNRALQHIQMSDPDFPVPRVVAAKGGNTLVAIEGQDGRCHQARVLSWLEGTPLSAADGGADVARPAGECLARLDLALCDFVHAASNHHLLWDMKRAAGLLELLSSIGDESLRSLCADRLNRFHEFIESRLPQLRQQVIYNDLNPCNLLVDPTARDSLAGVIDFGDMIFSPLVVDVAVGAAYLCSRDADPFAEVVEFLRAYTSTVPLEEDGIALLYDLIIMRHLMTVVITNWRAARYPENRDYILRNEAKARATINGVVRLSASAVEERFRQACGIR